MIVLAPEEALPAGSYLASVYLSPQARRHRAGGIRLRVIEYEPLTWFR